MVERRLTDGRRIAELLASEVEGREDGFLEGLSVADADTDVEPTPEGARAYDIHWEPTPEASGADPGRTASRLAHVFVHEDRSRLEIERGQERVVTTAESRDLRVRPKASSPPKTIVFVESGAEVKRAVDVLESACEAFVTDVP